MNTGVVNQNLNFNQTSSNTNTSSSIKGVSVNNKASTTNTTTSNNNSQIESMDLSFATENTNNNDDITKVANGFSKIVEGFNDIGNGTLGLINTAGATLAKTATNIGSEVKSVISDAKNMVVDKAKDIIDTAASIGNKVKSGVKDFFGNIIDGLKGIGSTLKETCSNIASNASTILGNIGNWAKDTAASIGSTAAVVGTSVVSGIANLGEGIVDGLAWTGGKIVEGGSWLVGKVAGLFSKDAEESVMNWREEAKTGVKEFIATDWVGEANKAFYENTDIGRAINENSYLKYDSKIAQGISGATETIGKIALATAATIGTGGAAAPLALGFLFGTGEKAEKLYQENINTTGAQELGIFISGLGEAANWYAQGKLGEGAVGLFNVIKNTGLKQTGALAINGVKSLIGNIKTNGIGNTLKGMLGSTKVSSMMAADNLADSAGIIGDNTSRWLTGEEEFNLGNVAKAGGELLSAWSLNMFFDGASDYLMNGGKIKEMPELQSSSPSPSIQSHSDIDFTTSTSLTDVGKKLEEMVQSKYGKSFLDLTDYGYEGNKLRYGKEIADGMSKYYELSRISMASSVDLTTSNSSSVKPNLTADLDNTEAKVATSTSSAEVVRAATPDYFEKIKQTSTAQANKYTTELTELSKMYGVSPKEMQQILDRKLKELVDSSDFGKRTSLSTLERMLDTDGMMKTQFETGKSGGAFAPDLRKDVELRLFEVPKDIADVDRPLYGMCIPDTSITPDSVLSSYIKSGPGYWYGSGDGCILVFDKSKVIDAATITVGDSLDYETYLSGTTAIDPKFKGGFYTFLSGTSTIDDVNAASLTDLFTSGDQYLEVQLHGRDTHSLDNISEVLFTNKQPSPELIQKLEARGIKWRII